MRGGVPLPYVLPQTEWEEIIMASLAASATGASATYPVPAEWRARAMIKPDIYDAFYAEAARDPDAFWKREAQRLDWMTPFTAVKNTSFNEADFGIKWFEDGALNVSANCIDRHMAERPDAIAIIWEGDAPDDSRIISYRELHDEVCRLANAMKANGIRKGDRVTIYLPMIPEAAAAMLACARIGAIHSVVFGGFSPDSLAGRITDCDSQLVITADEGLRGGKRVPLKANVDEALTHCTSVETVIVARRTGADIAMKDGRDIWYHDAVGGDVERAVLEPLDAEVGLVE